MQGAVKSLEKSVEAVDPKVRETLTTSLDLLNKNINILIGFVTETKD